MQHKCNKRITVCVSPRMASILPYQFELDSDPDNVYEQEDRAEESLQAHILQDKGSIFKFQRIVTVLQKQQPRS